MNLWDYNNTTWHLVRFGYSKVKHLQITDTRSRWKIRNFSLTPLSIPRNAININVFLGCKHCEFIVELLPMPMVDRRPSVQCNNTLKNND